MRRKSKNMGSKGRWASASHWLQHRRAVVRKAVSEKGDEGSSRKIMISKMASRLWGPKHEKEMEFNKKKENKRRIQAFRQGMIFKGKKRLAQQAAAEEESEKKKRKLYFKNVRDRDLIQKGTLMTSF
ncbi:unnamed protein product [Cladocopium goreaui]|uniref:Uncharacterized protein n=1 Tax=Cladocopium goreaui TaxID=2562237 RepID=A0A9P1CZD4_9DINO|nr:unnamed protein product [Cladocopium goreaui]